MNPGWLMNLSLFFAFKAGDRACVLSVGRQEVLKEHCLITCFSLDEKKLEDSRTPSTY